MSPVHEKKRSTLDRSILHCDCNGFFASVECLDHPAYWDVPMAVAGDPKDRSGIILAKNELAKKYGIITAETIYSAKRKCPRLVLVPPRHWRYKEISTQVNLIYLRYTDQVEPFSIDESFLDVTGSLPYFHSTAYALADRIREQVKHDVGITISVGVSFNKTFAKLASDMKKPNATTEITRENYQTLIWSLPIRDMLFIGKASVGILQKNHINTIGDLAGRPKEEVIRLLGKAGEALWHNANGLDADPIRPYGERETVKSVGNGMTFRRDLISYDEIRQGVIALSDEVAVRLRENGLKARTVQVTIKDPSLKTISRQMSLDIPTHLQKELVETVMAIIRANWHIMPDGRCAPIRALTITGQNLMRDKETLKQMSLFDLVDGAKPSLQRSKREKLENTIEQLRAKHGSGIISLGYGENEELGIRPFGRHDDHHGADSGNG
ncbi:MAG: DNA polymerase IV [Eubacteriales bacterium]|nr:DNA polymerase IV [Eubacteriales bacterium]